MHSSFVIAELPFYFNAKHTYFKLFIVKKINFTCIFIKISYTDFRFVFTTH